MIEVAYLAMIQGGNALIPLVLFPYILSKLGAPLFAHFATLEAVSFIILTISLYSFDITGLKEILKATRIGKKAVARTYYAILYTRLALFCLCTVIYLPILYFYNPELFQVGLIWLLFPLGITIQSSYLYQAINHNLPLALFVVIPRIATCILAFLLINHQTSLIIASAYISLSYLISGLSSTLFLSTSLGFISPQSSKDNIISLFHSGKHIFTGNLCVLLYRGSNTILLSFLGAPAVAVSLYAIAEKYIKMFQAVVFPLTQVYAVRLTRSLSIKGHSIWSHIWDSVKFQLLIIVSLSVIVILGVIYVIPKIRINIPAEMTEIFMLMLPAVLFGVINYMSGTITYAALGFSSAYAKIVWTCGTVSLLIAILLAYYFHAVGAALAYAFAEFLLAATLLLHLKRRI